MVFVVNSYKKVRARETKTVSKIQNAHLTQPKAIWWIFNVNCFEYMDTWTDAWYMRSDWSNLIWFDFFCFFFWKMIGWIDKPFGMDASMQYTENYFVFIFKSDGFVRVYLRVCECVSLTMSMWMCHDVVIAIYNKTNWSPVGIIVKSLLLYLLFRNMQTFICGRRHSLTAVRTFCYF